MPGRLGTVPAALTAAVWEDWLAAVRVGVRHVRERIGPDKPLVLVGLFERRRARVRSITATAESTQQVVSRRTRLV